MWEGNGFPEHAETMGRSSSTCPRVMKDGGRETACLGVSESQQDKLSVLPHGRGESRVGCKPGAKAMVGWGAGQGQEPSQHQCSLGGNHKSSTGLPGSCFPLQDQKCPYRGKWRGNCVVGFAMFPADYFHRSGQLGPVFLKISLQ